MDPNNDFQTIDPNDPEWALMWSALGQASGDTDNACICPETGEMWQYMGTEARLRVEHCFRHRSHPRHGGSRIYIAVPASDEFAGQQDVRDWVAARRSAPPEEECPF